MRARKTFKDRAEELKAYREKNGHINVKEGEDKSLAQFCRQMRYARRNPETIDRKLTEERIAELDALGFEWAPRNRKEAQFQQRLEELKAYKAEHGHLNVKKSEDKSLARFCINIRSARRGRQSHFCPNDTIAVQVLHVQGDCIYFV